MEDGREFRPLPQARRVGLPARALNRLMPMHLHLSPQGRITSCGPTLAKVAAGQPLVGQAFFQVFEVRRPARITTLADLLFCQGVRLHLCLRGSSGAEFRGLAIPDAEGGLLLNLSFGIGIVEAVRAHALTDSDFAATDLTMEMLYLVEAKRAVLEEFQRRNTHLLGAKTEAEEQALTDTLTGLRNRRAMDLALSAACGGQAAFALMHLDLDRFKAVNDTLGHAAGDHVLRAVATVLASETRAGDVVARVGGDEFVVLLPGLTDLSRLTYVAERMIAGLAQPIPFENTHCQIGVSVGFTTSTLYERPEAERMLQDADQALYAAKRAGRGQVVAFEWLG